MIPSTVRLSLHGDRVELDSFADAATLGDLVAGLDAFTAPATSKARRCRGCGECCFQDIPVLGADIPALAGALGAGRDRVIRDHVVLPESHPSVEERGKAIREMARQMKMSEERAALIYGYNATETAILRKREDGACCFLRDGLCSIYDARPLGCRIYFCAMGDELSVLHENIVRQGTCHLHHSLGWIGEEEMRSNAFASAAGWESVPLTAFNAPDIGEAEGLFFYF